MEVNKFPIEIVDMILDILTVSDLIKFSILCKSYFYYVTQVYPKYWKKLYHKRWKVGHFCADCVSVRCKCNKFDTSWKSKYLERLLVEEEFNSGGYKYIYKENHTSFIVRQ
jgi:hypothetical protein